MMHICISFEKVIIFNLLYIVAGLIAKVLYIINSFSRVFYDPILWTSDTQIIYLSSLILLNFNRKIITFKEI